MRANQARCDRCPDRRRPVWGRVDWRVYSQSMFLESRVDLVPGHPLNRNLVLNVRQQIGEGLLLRLVADG
jgi:hypothetical protein